MKAHSEIRHRLEHPNRRPSPLTHQARRVVSPSSAFTLIELLVVIAIIAILAALLMPALAKAKARGQSIACMSNLKQLETAWLMYLHDNNDSLPPNITRNLRAQPGSWVVGNAQSDTSASNLQSGVLFSYVGAAGVYRCPSDKSTVTGHPALARFRSYTLSLFMNCDGVWPDGTVENPQYDPLIKAKLSGFVDPPASRMFGFIDEHQQSIDDGVMIVSNIPYGLDNYDLWFDLPSDRHSQGCNISFADGHVEHWKWKWPKTFYNHKQPFADPTRDPQHLDRQDLRHLQACVPLQ